jgi:biopolymer transport protein ExbD
MWFNPFIHLAARALSQVQEWEADSDVLNQGVDIDLYRKTIFHQLFGYTPDITCGLNNNLTKKRFIMMTTFKRGKSSLLRILAVIPIVVATILIFGSVHAKPKQEVTEPVIIDSFDIKSTIQIRDGGKEILLNDEPVTLQQLGEAVKQTIDKVVTISAENDVPMGTVADIKETLRESGVTKVNYSKPETTTKTIKARNILIVDVKADGSVFVRGEQFTNENKLKREVKRFIHNFRLATINTRVLRIVKISGGRQYERNSEFTTTAVKMGEGVHMACPVSKGIVSINSELPMGSPALESVSNTIYEAFMELREKMAHRIYNKSYVKLDETQKAEIDKVVPINISLALKE